MNKWKKGLLADRRSKRLKRIWSITTYLMRKLMLRLVELALIMKRVKRRDKTKRLIQISHALLQRPSLSSNSKLQVVQCPTNQQKPWIIRRYLTLLKYIITEQSILTKKTKNLKRMDNAVTNNISVWSQLETGWKIKLAAVIFKSSATWT